MKARLQKTTLIETFVTLTALKIKWFKSMEDVRLNRFEGSIKLPNIYEINKV